MASTFDLDEYYIGIDVGTGSARAALVNARGELIASSTKETTTWRDKKDARIFEQSTTDIWTAICAAVKDVLASGEGTTRIAVDRVKGLGIDATCSLAVTDWDGNPICVSDGEGCGAHGERNIVLWADHRAEEEANKINATGSVVLDYVGGSMSLEMEIPKILWLKKHMSPERFKKCMFFDLPDYLTYKATGSTGRSACSLVCKCSFIPPGASTTDTSSNVTTTPPAGSPHAVGWNTTFFADIGLDDIDLAQLGGAYGSDESLVLTAGLPVGAGLTEAAAKDLGLNVGTPVGSAVIDAYAGWIGTVAARYRQPEGREQAGELSRSPTLEDSKHYVAAVAGTSTCYMVQTAAGKFVPGVWGPYRNALFPGWWMTEGGQSSTGQLIDFTISTHPARSELESVAKERSVSIFAILDETLEELRSATAAEEGSHENPGQRSLTYLTRDLHFYPDLHGNRSPLADSRMRGSIVGLALDSGLDDLAKKYNVTLEAIALQTRHIMDEMNANGHEVQHIFISGGQAKNKRLVQLLSDVCDMPIILPANHSTAVVLGAAMLGKFAAEVTDDMKRRGTSGVVLKTQKEVEEEGGRLGERLWGIMVQMTQPGVKISPAAKVLDKRLLEAKYKIFRESIEIQKRWRKEVDEAVRG